MKKILLFICLFLPLMSFSQRASGDIYLYGYNAYIQRGGGSFWYTWIDGVPNATTDFHFALSMFFTTKLQKVREFELRTDDYGTVAVCKYLPDRKLYELKWYGGDNAYYFERFYDVRKEIEWVLVEAVREGLFYRK